MSRLALAVTLACVTAATAVAPAGAVAARMPDTQVLASLLRDHTARTAPSAHARRIENVASLRPLTHVRTVLPVLGRKTTRGQSWLHVILPGRPSGHTGWILATHTKRSTTAWRLVIRLGARSVTAYQDGLVKRTFQAVVGAPATPTPQGHFFIEEALSLTTSDPGGPFALATSARSDVLQEFDGGPGQIAIHGMYNLAGEPGTAVSHGCIRLTTAAITWLAQRIGSGVPLTISG